jgi:acyl-CoA thioesterase-1
MMADKPKLVLVALGANDALRGTDPAETERNLDAIITKLKAEGAAVMLFGMAAPRNYGPEYTKAFDGLYPKLADKHKIPLYPFLLDGVAMERDLNQADGIHPNVKGVDVLVTRITPELIKAIDALK